MKHSLQLKLSQHLTLTPQLQQSIRLLQLSTIELNQELERYLAENPLLERAETDPDAPPPPPLNGSTSTSEVAAPAESREEPAGFVDEGTGFGDDAPSGMSRSRSCSGAEPFAGGGADEPSSRSARSSNGFSAR